jgi:hypothetical protein
MSRAIQIALATFVFGFVIEGGTEIYQFVSYGHPVWVGLYYIGLVTTGAGFYFMYRGSHQWAQAHLPKVRRARWLLWAALAMFIGAVAAIAVLGWLEGGPGHGAPSPLIVWTVGGLVALAFGNFFLGLVVLVEPLVSRIGRILSWTAFAWSLGVAVLTGYGVGKDFLTLLHEFFTNPLGLIISFAPLAFVIAPLFVTYFLFAGAYTDALLGVRAAAQYPSPSSIDPVTSSGPGARQFQEKSTELKALFKDLGAVLEQWKFSAEETGEGTRVEIHAIARIRHSTDGKREES